MTDQEKALREIVRMGDYTYKPHEFAEVALRALFGDLCACVTTEEGWRPCPKSLCERSDHDHR